MHSNLLPWSSALVDPSMSHACYPPRPMLPAAPDNSSHIHAPDLAIQGVQGFETTSIMPLTTRQMAAHIIDPCYQASTDVSRAFDPVKLPSIAASFERNPSHAARAAMYTRFTPYEWTQSNINYYNEADANRNLSEKIRSEAIRVMRETEERTAIGQRDSGRRLGERLTDITFWRNELSTELEKMLAEIALLQDTRRALEKAIRDCEPPLSVAQECLYHREARQGIDLVHDQAEQALLKEIETLRHCKEQLNAFYNRVVEQLRCCRSSQHEVEMDIKSKHSASQVDSLCYQMNNYSRGINYFAGIESVDPTLTIPESWADHSNRIIQRSSTERSKSSQLRSDSDNCINDCANRIWNAWNYSNSALARRTNEILEAKNKLQMHLHKTQQEIFDVEKNIELLRKAIQDKSAPIKVAQSRLEARIHRKDVELCRDGPQLRLVSEVEGLKLSLSQLHQKLSEAEHQHQNLILTKSKLEQDLHVKSNSLFIDRESCLGLRRTFPTSASNR
ncbi:hypothetical protein M8J77_008644 [Diaphorina citri]|nr:hypothetical protein M8J77_008644 [Diaphorina citri]